MCRFATGPRMRPIKPRMNAGENFGAFPAAPAAGNDRDGPGEQSVGSRRKNGNRRGNGSYSHSIVPGGFEVMSYVTRLMPGTSLTIRVATRPRKSGSKG